ncbi:pilus assembly protein [Gemmobacter fulvus]|uniref:Pilus assembly protein n=1 Tax=Gemmobacter fulvus TaxID=2840474 RepID=A0A975P883_9RHOB|nr:TadE/TadG family type IV pilus assembly protein [Gemmobacter fulvus]MBT9244311.1 pilus assembly protein [Gemmobacter fulvus]QWK91197.1 pilus assembly protein [Gemmobacter fulvus]
MIRAVRAFCAARLRRFRREDGTASIEFVLMIPVFMSVFMASFETGVMMVRQTMLDRALDIAMRDLRLGHLGETPTHDELKAAICDRVVFLTECSSTLKVDMQQVDTTTWIMPAGGVVCRDRAEPIDLPLAINPESGARSEMMIVRACARADALFPSTGVALGLSQDGMGGYRLVAASAFVNEP